MERKRNVLVVEGGGVRVLYQLMILKTIEEKVREKLKAKTKKDRVTETTFFFSSFFPQKQTSPLRINPSIELQIV